MSQQNNCFYCEGRGEKSQLLYEPDPLREQVMLEYDCCLLPCYKCDLENYIIKREEALVIARKRATKYNIDNKCKDCGEVIVN